MKKNGWIIILVAVLLAGLVTARADGQLDATKPVAEKPAKKAKAAKKVKAPVAESKPAAEEKPIVLSTGAATVVGKNVNVRGRAGFAGEVFTKLNNGDAITIIEQVILPKPKAGEPAQWAKIAFPANAHVWVHNSYIDENKTVKPKKLNLRTGPGENYSVVGTIEKGTPVKEVSTKGNWVQIEAPAGTYGFIAASYVQQTASHDSVPTLVSLAPPETATVAQGSAIATNTTDNTGVIATNNPAGEPTPVVTADPNGSAPPPVLEEIEVPRFVSHEGVVRGTVSIQAATKYGLYNKENGKLINYLYSPSPQLDLGKYFNRHIIVSGQEGLDERWKNTPVLTIQKIYVVQ